MPLEVPIAGVVKLSADKGTTDLLKGYVVEVYEFIVGGIGIVAVIAIMYWGFRWVTAAGNQTIIGNAKEGIQSALIGLVIAMTSYTILALINPALVSLPSATVSRLAFPEETVGIATSNFSTQDCTTLGVNFLQSLPPNLSAHMNWSAGSSAPCLLNTSYEALVRALTELDNPDSPYYGMKIDISSGYRSYELQYHLFSCDSARTYSDIPSTSREPCPAYYISSTGRYFLNADGSAGSIKPVKGYTPVEVQPSETAQAVACGSQCNGGAAAPGTSNHESGYAIDVAWFKDPNIAAPNATFADLTGGRRNIPWHVGCMVAARGSGSCTTDEYDSVVALDRFMQGSGFKRICKEWWHFESGSTTSTGCAVGDYRLR